MPNHHNHIRCTLRRRTHLLGSFTIRWIISNYCNSPCNSNNFSVILPRFLHNRSSIYIFCDSIHIIRFIKYLHRRSKIAILLGIDFTGIPLNLRRRLFCLLLLLS